MITVHQIETFEDLQFAIVGILSEIEEIITP